MVITPSRTSDSRRRDLLTRDVSNVYGEWQSADDNAEGEVFDV